ncbi:MAG: hypothetical protein O3B04_03835 [Chloroflexi bacterium]|nr:hypothetical protein [Chloroflexota bacterium]
MLNQVGSIDIIFRAKRDRQWPRGMRLTEPIKFSMTGHPGRALFGRPSTRKRVPQFRTRLRVSGQDGRARFPRPEAFTLTDRPRAITPARNIRRRRAIRR